MRKESTFGALAEGDRFKDFSGKVYEKVSMETAEEVWSGVETRFPPFAEVSVFVPDEPVLAEISQPELTTLIRRAAKTLDARGLTGTSALVEKLISVAS